MLLLTSVILLIGFIALSSMVIRVTQLPEETTQDARKPIDLEADAVAEGVRQLLLRTQERPATAIDAAGYGDYKAAAEASLATLVDLEQGRGFRFTHGSVLCTDDQVATPGEVHVSVTVTLSDLDTRVQVTVSETFLDATVPLRCSP